MIALLALWYDVLRFGRPLTFVVIIAISGVIRLARRSRGPRQSPLPPQPFQQQQFPQQQQYPQQPYPPQAHGQPQQQYPQQPYPPRAYGQPRQPYPQQPDAAQFTPPQQFTPPPPMPAAPFAHPISDPFAPNPLAGQGDRPRSTPLPPTSS